MFFVFLFVPGKMLYAHYVLNNVCLCVDMKAVSIGVKIVGLL